MKIFKACSYLLALTAYSLSFSGCILSAYPNEQVVFVNPGEVQVFEIRVLPGIQTYSWQLDGVQQGSSGSRYEYTPTGADAGEHEVRVTAGKDQHSWKVLVKSVEVSTWEKSYDVGSPGYSDFSSAVLQTDDGGYVVAGITDSRLSILRLDNAGVRQWERKLDNFYDYYWPKISTVQAKDGGFVIVSTQKIKVGEDYDNRVAAIKLDGSGNTEWSQYYLNNEESLFISLIKVSGGGYILHARSMSAGNVMIRLDSNFMARWETATGFDNSVSEVIETDDGGFMAVQPTYNGVEMRKYDSLGNFLWEKSNNYCYGCSASIIMPAGHGEFLFYSYLTTTKFDQTGEIQWSGKGITDSLVRYYTACAISQTSDGGYIVGGCANPVETEIFACLPVCMGVSYRECHIYCDMFPIIEYPNDAWVLKLDAGGEIKWNRYYGNKIDNHKIISIMQTSDGGFIAAGRKTSKDGKTNMFYVLKLDMQGNLE